MKKTLILLGLFLVLGGGAYWYLSQDKSGTKQTLGWDRQFKIENPEEIHKIFIAKRNGVTTTLERNGKSWLYNGKYKANRSAISNIMQVLTSIRMKYVPPNNSVKNMVEDLSSNGIKVEVYNKSGDNLKTFYIGGTTTNERGTYIIMEGSDQPLVGELPMLEGAFRVRFSMEGDAWRDKTIYGYEIDELEFVSVEYPKQKNKSFKLKIDGNNYQLSPFYEITQPINKPIVNGTVESFLIGFSRQIAESIINDSSKKVKIDNEIPFAIVHTRDKNGLEKIVSLFPYENVDGQQVERHYAHVISGENEDFMMTQQRNIGKVLWAYQAFYPK